MTLLARLLVLGLAAASLSACASTADDGFWVELKGKRYTVEVADDAGERERGLMFRDHLGPEHGMLFIHEREEDQAYWMMNTKIPLDILYFDQGRRLVSVQRRVPPCSLGDKCPSFPSDGPAMYVLELEGGSVETMELKPGDELKFGPAIPKPR